MGLISLTTRLFILHPCWHFLSAGAGQGWCCVRWAMLIFRIIHIMDNNLIGRSLIPRRFQGSQGWSSSFCSFQIRCGTSVPSRGFGEGGHWRQLKCFQKVTRGLQVFMFWVGCLRSGEAHRNKHPSCWMRSHPARARGKVQRGGRSSLHRRLTRAPCVLLTVPGDTEVQQMLPWSPGQPAGQLFCRSHGHLQLWFKLHDSFPLKSLQVP